MGKQYEMAFAIGAKVNGSFNSAFKSAATGVQGLQQQINSLNKTAGDISSYQKTQTAIEKTKQKLALYQQQYANLKAEMDRNGQASAAEQNALLAKAKAIDDLKAKQEQLESRLASTGSALEKEGVDLNNLGDASTQTGQQIEQLKQKQMELADASAQAGDKTAQAVADLQAAVGALGIVEGLKKVADAFKDCAEQAIAFEAEMAAVRRTTGGSEEYIGDLGDAFKEISTEIPITTSELAQIATTAGQLGVAQDQVEQFTVVMAKLATTTDLTADEAATMLAQFANITGITDYERMGAVVAQLGDSTATTASKVVQMSQGMAAAANIAGMGATDIMAISAALGSLGIEAQAGSTSMSQLITTLYKATETGENLSEFAAVAGMTAAQFKQAWATDAVGAMNAFITGLNDVERNGRSAIVILDELGINNVRQQKAILGLASAGDLLTNTITQANSAWAENTALNEKAGIMYDTTQAKMTMMNSSFNNLKIAIGDAFAPLIGEVADGLNQFMQPVTEFIAANPTLVKAIGAAAAALGVATAALAAYTIGAKIAAAASATLTAAMPYVAAFMALAAGVVLVADAINNLGNSADDASQQMVDLNEQYQELSDAIDAQDHVIKLCEDYKKLNKQTEYAVDNFKEMEGFTDITISASADATVSPDEFLIDGNHVVSIDGDPQSTMDADNLLDADGNIVQIYGTPAEGNGVDADTLLDSDGNVVSITGSAGDTKVDADDLVKNHGIVLTATEPDKEHKLEASVFVNGQKIEFEASWANRDEFEKDVENLKAQAQIAKKDLADAQTTFDHLKEYKQQLLARQKFAGTDAEKASLSGQLAEVNEQITLQEEELARLQTAYDEAGGKYVIAANAAEALAEKDAQLAAIQAELGISTSGATDDIDDQTDAIWRNIEAREAEANVERNKLRGQLLENLTTGAQRYYETLNGKEGLGYDHNTMTYYERRSSAAQKAADLAGSYLESGYEQFNADMASTFAQIDERIANGTASGKDFEDLLIRAQTYSVMGQYGAQNSGKNWDSWTGYDLYAEYMKNPEKWISEHQGTGLAKSLKVRNMTSGDSLNNAISAAMKYAEATSTTYQEKEAAQQAYLDRVADALYNGYFTQTEVENAINGAFEDYEDGAATAATAIDYVNQKVAEMQLAAQGASSAAEGSAEQVIQSTQPIIDQMNELSEAYANAYDAAYKSISGQFSLFEEMEQAKPGEKSVDDYIAALESQKAYMDQYTDNLAAVKEMGLSDAMISQLSDGSKESAEILATIVDQGATKIDELNDAYASVETGKQQFADTVAEMETDFTTKMQALEEQLNTTVESMNQSEAAAAAGADTMQAFADAAAGKQSAVESAFAKVAAAALRKLTSGLTFPGFAGGTHSAPEGFAMVGENGPELVYLHGGERILDAQETQRTMDAMSLQPVNAMSASGSGGQYSIEYKPQYNISGSMNADELQRVLDEHDAGMRDRLEEMMDDIEKDRNRRRYA